MGICHEGTSTISCQSSQQKKYQKVVKTSEKTQGELVDKYISLMQDEAIVIANTRHRKGVYTLRHKRAVFTYTVNRAKITVFGLITGDGQDLVGRYNMFTKEEFDTFRQGAHVWFGKMSITLHSASLHRANIIKDVITQMNGDAKLMLLPSGCPVLNAIEGVWC